MKWGKKEKNEKQKQKKEISAWEAVGFKYCSTATGEQDHTAIHVDLLCVDDMHRIWEKKNFTYPQLSTSPVRPQVS